MSPSHTTVSEYRGDQANVGYASAVSLHAHTNRSKEVLRDAPRYLERIPVVARLVQRELHAYYGRHGSPVDFAKAWWRPPLGVEAVLDSEASQIRRVLGLQPLVSITDHDTIDARLDLAAHQTTVAPISVEWTLPFDRGFFHLGVHNFKPPSAAACMQLLSTYARDPDPSRLGPVFEALVEDPGTLVVLNHPLWDLAGVGSTDHIALLQRFLSEHAPRIHALELNGYRSWRENCGVKTLAETYGLPLVSGGDRHGCAPNSLLNLSTATCFSGFVHEIRVEHHSAILVLPQYRTELVTRKLGVAADAMRSFPRHPSDQRHWTDRVCYERHGRVETLAESWPDGGPPWVRLTVRAFQLGSSEPILPLMRMFVWLAGASNSYRVGPAALVEAGQMSSPAAMCRMAPEGRRGTGGGAPDRRVTVAMVCDGIGDTIGGSFVSTARFAERLAARGHRIVFISSGSIRQRGDHEYRGLRIHRLAGVPVPWSDGLRLAMTGTERLRAILTAERIDIVHVMIPLPLGLMAVRATRSLGLPLVMHSHTQPENIFMNAPPFPGRTALTRRFCAYLAWLYRQADVMIYPSAFSRRQFPSLVLNRHVVVSNGVDLETFHPSSRDAFVRRYGLTETRHRLLYLGRLHREKNIGTLIRAMPAILAAHPDAQLVIVGRGYQRAMLTALARTCGIASNVTFCGFVPDEDLPAAYAACDLFVLPSLAELEGMVVLEAMACGKPVLIADSRLSAATEFVNGNGLLFRAGDSGDLAQQAILLLADPERLQGMARASLATSRSFDINDSTAALESLYCSLVSP